MPLHPLVEHTPDRAVRINDLHSREIASGHAGRFTDRDFVSFSLTQKF